MSYLNRAIPAKAVKNIQVTLALVSALILLIVAAPVSRAGELDFLIAIDDSSNLYYALSNDDGTFSDYHYIDYLGGVYSRGVTINDFNNDGFLDIVAGRGIGSTAYFYLFLNDGLNNFTKIGLVGTLSNANSHAMDMSSGDFNNDGNQDFIANGNYWNSGVYLGDGAGAFTKTEMNLGSYGRGMDVGDFNNDGNLDFARASYSNGYTYIHPGNGDGTFGDAIYVGDTGGDPYGLVAGDFNNDGLVDLIINDGGGGDPYFFAGNVDFTFADPVYVTSLDFDNHGAYDGYDYNSDGNLDIVAVNNTGKGVYFYPGNGDGTFGAAVYIGATSSSSIGDSAQPIGPPAGVPTALISPASATIAAGGSVDFDGSGSSDDGSIASWDWDFGDSGLDTVENPAAHTYTDEGTYYPTLKVTDNDGKSDIAPAKVIVQGNAPVVDTT
ncbi:MAG: VCBS repeat-containing protein, partial [Deltaproteobacteria bacterium]|nr:VCBS repeat-containing protein [Deltaproteobacteria bacterium]